MDAPTDSGYVTIHSGDYSFVGRKAEGYLRCWGTLAENQRDSCANLAPTESGFVSVVPGMMSYAALKADGRIAAFGSATGNIFSGPRFASGGSGAPTGTGFAAIYGNENAFVARKQDGYLLQWGSNCWDDWGMRSEPTYCGDEYETQAPTDSGYTRVFGLRRNFAAIKGTGSRPVTWGQDWRPQHRNGGPMHVRFPQPPPGTLGSSNGSYWPLSHDQSNEREGACAVLVTESPTASPTAGPSNSPTTTPSRTPTTLHPTAGPSASPSALPTESPTESPVTPEPSPSPTPNPTAAPLSTAPTAPPSTTPTLSPAVAPPVGASPGQETADDRQETADDLGESPEASAEGDSGGNTIVIVIVIVVVVIIAAVGLALCGARWRRDQTDDAVGGAGAAENAMSALTAAGKPGVTKENPMYVGLDDGYLDVEADNATSM